MGDEEMTTGAGDMNGKKKYRPYFIPIQKMVLYETRNRFFLVGSNQTESKFRILKIDRTEPKELVLVEDQARYSSKEMKELLSTIACINRPKNPAGLVRTVSAFGIIGFVQFLEGYYIILVTKRRKVATIGYHSVYKIEDTACIYIPCDGPSKNPDELRYLKLFQSIDLSSNFYFTYSYDLTNSLQYNIAQPKGIVPGCKVINPELVAGYAVSNMMNRKFVWNDKLLEPMKEILHPDWLLYVTHGFVGQSCVCIYGKPVYLTLIARRSAKYAGTRFLKRGANFQGDVANEVETEQIVFDSSVSSFSKGRFTSFVQMRGSIPAHWSQDIAKMVPKPPIGIDLGDPFAETSGKHFGELLARFGSPLVIINLVKKRERKKHESILTEEFTTAVKTLNQFLPPKHRMIYVGFDMARTNKMKEENVMVKLAEISEDVFRKTGFLMTHQPLHSCSNQEKKKSEINGVYESCPYGRLQTGIVRINCVDCLDRTNTAQFALGKCALAHQLRALGVLSADCDLEFESDIIRMLEELYEDHGHTLALQYGGSQLVHRIDTYRKTAPWTSQGNDIMQTLSRYYSNTFSDADKQNAINLFLGVFQPSIDSIPIWSLENDLHMHLKLELRFTNQNQNLKPLTEWFPSNVRAALPFASHETEKVSYLLPCDNFDDIDQFSDLYRPKHFIPLNDMFSFKVSHSIRDFMPNFTTDYSPFGVRIRPGKRQEENISKKASKIISMKNPSRIGLGSTASSTNSTSSESDYSSSEEMSTSMATSNVAFMNNGSAQTHGGNLVFAKLFPTMKDSYGVELKAPRKSDIMLYKRFVNYQTHLEDRPANLSPSKAKQSAIIPLSAFSKDSSYCVTPPTVSRISRDIYKNYVRRGKEGTTTPGRGDLSVYKRYVSKSGNPFQNSASNKPNFKS